MLSNSLTNRRARLSSARGFTLIELLVVIAIIAILAAILFPVFASVREKARQTACLSNMNQIGKSNQMYKDDFDENYVPMQQVTAGQTRSWPSIIYPYIKSEAVFVCPSAQDVNLPVNQSEIHVAASGAATALRYCGNTDSDVGGYGNGGDGSTNATWADGTPTRLVHGLSYSMNALQKSTIASGRWHSKYNGVVFQTTPATKQGFVGVSTTKSVTESDVQDPAGTIQIVDAMSGGDPTTAPASGWNGCSLGNAQRGIQYETKTDYEPDDEATKPAPRHNDGFVALFGDGHSKWIKYGTTRPCMWTIQDDNKDCTGTFAPF